MDSELFIKKLPHKSHRENYMNFNRKSAKAWSIVLATILLLLSACSGKNNAPIVMSSSDSVPENFTVTLCENVFNNFLYSEIAETDLIYLNIEKHAALRETDIIINQENGSSFWTITTFKDLVAREEL